MEDLRQAMHKAIGTYGLDSEEALKASEELDKAIIAVQRERVLTKEEVVKRFVNDKYKKRYNSKSADRYAAEKAREGKSNAAMHTKRCHYHKSK